MGLTWRQMQARVLQMYYELIFLWKSERNVVQFKRKSWNNFTSYENLGIFRPAIFGFNIFKKFILAKQVRNLVSV